MVDCMAKAKAVCSLWFEFLSSYPIGFEVKKPMCGQVADFYSETARLAIFVDSPKLTESDEKEPVRKLYFTSSQIKKEMPLVCTVIDAYAKNELLMAM